MPAVIFIFFKIYTQRFINREEGLGLGWGWVGVGVGVGLGWGLCIILFKELALFAQKFPYFNIFKSKKG